MSPLFGMVSSPGRVVAEALARREWRASADGVRTQIWIWFIAAEFR